MCTLNFLLVCIFIKEYNTATLVASVISGWISGVSTLVVGIIASYQSKQYQQANDAFLQKQYRLEQCTSVINNRILFVDNLKKSAEKYMANCNPSFMLLRLTNIVKDPIYNDKYMRAREIITDYIGKLNMHHSSLSHLIDLDYCNSESRSEVKKMLTIFYNSFYSSVDTETKLDSYSKNPNIFLCQLLDKLKINDLYVSTEEAICKYIVHSDFDINEAIFYKKDDISELEKLFSPKNVSDSED